MKQSRAWVQMDDEPGSTETAALVLHEAQIHLRRRADERIKNAIWVGALQLAGYRSAEIRSLLGLSVQEHRSAVRWLKEAIAATTGRTLS